ncbi:MAG: DUF819 family protein [Mariniphaga sp.]|nr:DUF819 family protein [Mariniphaga sp.]
MVTTILLLLFFLLTPILLIYLCRISKTINKIGVVVLAYAVGLLIGNLLILPNASENYKIELGTDASIPKTEIQNLYDKGDVSSADLIVNQIKGLQDSVMSVAILLAIPLMLFSLDLKRWLKFARGAMLSLILAMVSLLTVIVLGYFLFKNVIPEPSKVAGMLIGVYTGGTPNLAAIGTALDVTPNTFILTHTYDMAIGALTLIFILTVAQRVFNYILPTFNENHKHILKEDISKEAKSMDDFTEMITRKGIPQLLLAFAISIIIVAVAIGLSMIVPEDFKMVTIILSITTLGLLASLVKKINRIKKSFQLGMYLIIVFSLIVASMGDILAMFQLDYIYLFAFVALAVIGSMVIHVGLSFLFKVDADSTIITITALTYSPPFVPVVASAIKNKEVIISGLTVGIIGYAFGNYLGIFIAYFLERL